ncbi:flagellar brake protein [Virgibacillus flavescens]|uniref:flagellar brake protein n=1 Tax=Virgibacillus flavescens TaxID=1611422 RepID=UPI003D34343A
MEIGTMITITVTDAETNVVTKYRSKIIEENDTYLFIDYPINMETKRTAALPKGAFIKVSYVGNDQSVYLFNTQVIAKVNVTIPALAISIPQESDIKRIQRRAFVRIETAVDVSVHHPGEELKSFATVTSDISGGGMSIVIPRSEEVSENDDLDLWIVLNMHNGEYNYIYSRAKAVRVITDKQNIHTASLKFESISKQDQQLVIRYCFEKQRELRTKERK